MIYDPVLYSPLDDFVNWIEPKEDIEGWAKKYFVIF